MIKRILTSVVLVVACVFLGGKIYEQRQILINFNWQFNFGSLVLMFVFLVMNYLSNLFAWHILMRSFGVKISILNDFRIWAFSNLTRFLPGKIWQYPSRIYLLAENNVPPAVSGTAILAEVVLNLFFGALVAILSFAFSLQTGNISLISQYRYLFIFLLLPIFYFLIINKSILSFLMRLVKKVSGKDLQVLNEIKFSFKWLPALSLAFIVRFIIPGIGLYFLASSLTSLNISYLADFIGAFSLSWLAGYAALFAPAGLGVAEVGMAVLLSLIIPYGFSSIIAVLFRIVNLIAEMIVVGVFFLLSRDYVGLIAARKKST